MQDFTGHLPALVRLKALAQGNVGFAATPFLPFLVAAMAFKKYWC